MREPGEKQVRHLHRHAWLWERLEGDPGFVLRPMFGTKALYINGKLMLCFSAKAEPWRGILVCTDRAHHSSLMAEFPVLTPHSILSKWLYLPESSDDFEKTAECLVRLTRLRDPRIGVAPLPKKRQGR